MEFRMAVYNHGNEIKGAKGNGATPWAFCSVSNHIPESHVRPSFSFSPSADVIDRDTVVTMSQV
jgi:hypothetical protein